MVYLCTLQKVFFYMVNKEPVLGISLSLFCAFLHFVILLLFWKRFTWCLTTSAVTFILNAKMHPDLKNNAALMWLFKDDACSAPKLTAKSPQISSRLDPRCFCHYSYFQSKCIRLQPCSKIKDAETVLTYTCYLDIPKKEKRK